MSTLLVVEDDVGLAAGLRQGLTEQGFGVVLAPTLRAARAALAQGDIDLVLLDLGLPDGDGLDLLGELRGAAGAPLVLVTSARGELEERLRGLEGGAEDYLVKPYAFAELVARVRILVRRVQNAAPARVEVADLSLDMVARRACRGGQWLDLTPREFDLLVRLALARGEVVSRDTLAREVWRMRSWTASMDNVIDVHMSRLRDKVDRDPAVRLVHTVRGVGFVLREPA